MRLLSFSLLAAIGCRSEIKTTEPASDGELTLDSDGDGYEAPNDCDDSDPQINPSMEEVCDGLDNNCDGVVDEGVTNDYYLDNDGDGFGVDGYIMPACSLPEGYATIGGDCNDSDENSYPSAPEECDDIDNDCNGEVDDGIGLLYYVDSDNDGYGDIDQPVASCIEDLSLSLVAGDCDDDNNTVFPDNVESCDGLDNNCDGEIDEGVLQTYYADSDNDGFGNAGVTVQSCSLPEAYVENDWDCQDVDSSINPLAIEYCDGIDNNCDGVIDEDTASDASTWYLDSDSDGFGDENNTAQACSAPSGYVDNPDDCNDGDSNLNLEGLFYLDHDGDGFGAAGISQYACGAPASYVSDATDCDDFSAVSYPGATEVCDGLDNDCDSDIDDDDSGIVYSDEPLYYVDSDNDGYGDASTGAQYCVSPLGYVDNGGDCNDDDVGISPDLIWYADFDSDGYGNVLYTTTSCLQPSGYVDNAEDCDDQSSAIHPETTWYLDFDSDGYGGSSITLVQCNQPNDYILDNTDCDDANADISPGAAEICDGLDNNCSGFIDIDDPDFVLVNLDTYYLDFDGDGYGDVNSPSLDCSPQSGYVSDSSDCDDQDAAVYPNGTEIVDGKDNDCDGLGYHGSFNSETSTAISSGPWEYTDFYLGASASLTFTDNDPIQIYVLDDAILDGTIDISGENGDDHGPMGIVYYGGSAGFGGGGSGGDGANYPSGSYDGGGVAPGLAAYSGSIGGGGGGGGHAEAGSDGSIGVCVPSRCGSSYTIDGGAGGASLYTGIPSLQPGSGGGGGGYGGADNGNGGGGGAGGGAIYISADSIEVGGSIDCSGGQGGSDLNGYDGGSGGGGSGGTAWLAASSISVTGIIRCTGGAGGQTVLGGTAAQGGAGGDGSDGMIWLDSSNISISGSTSPIYEEP